MFGHKPKSIEELQAENLPAMTALDLGAKPKQGFENDAETLRIIATLDSYLSQFVVPKKRDKPGGILLGDTVCICCGESLGGALGSFQYGLVSGEGQCRCGWPCRANHVIKDEQGNIFDRSLTIILQYHPSNVQKTE